MWGMGVHEISVGLYATVPIKNAKSGASFAVLTATSYW